MKNLFDLRNAVSGRFWAFILRPYFLLLGSKTRIVSPLKIKNLGRISIHNNVIINSSSWLQVHQDLVGELIIGEGSIIGNLNHIYALNKIVIGSHVLTADKVYISDCVHGFEQIDLPILCQPIKALPNVYIGDHSWIGENVVIIGASIGKHTIIGANSVVNKDIPDYCVAVGSPAKVIKKYSFDKKQWIRI